MHATLAHRGPNGEGFLVLDENLRAARGEALPPLFDAASARAALAFRWLIVQDPSPAAAQPMCSADGSIWLLFNGEIYNFPELRRELEPEGRQFATHGDTEVLLAAYERWGVDCFRHFRGMWAVLIVDLRRRVLVGSRDRFGIKPLFYRVENGRVLIASEAKAVIAAAAEVRIRQSFLYQYLNGERLDITEGTFYDGVYSVPAASRFEVPLDGPAPAALSFDTWWQLDWKPRPQIGYEEASGELERRLRDAIAVHLRACVKVGSFLSGGLDSAVITALMRNGSAPRDTYSLVFDEQRWAAFDESKYVDDFVASTGVPNFRTTFDAQWMRDNIRAVTWAQEEPLVASTLLAQWRVFELARARGATVVLDGQGSDEIFGGYARHELVVWRERLRQGRLPSFLRESRLIASSFGISAPALLYRHLVRTAGGSLVRRFRLPFLRYDWIDERFFISKRGDDREQRAARAHEVARWPSALDREMVRDLRFFALRPLLLFSDRSGMAHSVEARLPFLDHELVEFAMQLPPHFKVGFGRRKRILRDVARPYVPASIVDRTDKMGFVTPEAVWLRESLREDLREITSSPAVVRQPFLRLAAVKRFIDDFLERRHNDYRGVWRLYALKHWLEVYDLGA
jgi:asparagine synthase (glutamine-hydrolysing)